MLLCQACAIEKLISQVLIHMIHRWVKGADWNGATVRTVLFDYSRKAFDVTDHSNLVGKLINLELLR